MKKDIPQIQFAPETEEALGFEIVALEKIAKNQHEYEIDPETPHQLKFYNFIYITEGESQHFIDFTWHPIKKNSLIYLKKDQINAFQFDPSIKGYCLIFTEEFFVKCSSNFPKELIERFFVPQLSSPIVRIPENSTFIKYFQILKSEFRKTDNFSKNIIIESLFTILLSKAEEYKQRNTSITHKKTSVLLFQQFNTLLDINYNTTRSAEFYAKELLISYKHLNTVCKELINKTAKQIIDDFIILKAKRSLINVEVSSTELAYELGFEDPTNFTKYFKKRTGFTPNSFKKEHKN